MTQHRSHPNLGPSDPLSQARPQLPGQDTKPGPIQLQTTCTTLFNVSILQSTDLSGKFSLISTAVLSPTILCIYHVQKSIWSPRAEEKEDQRQAPLHRSQRRICHNPVFHLLP